MTPYRKETIQPQRRMTGARLFGRLAISSLLLCALLVAFLGVVHANGNTVHINLSYLSGVSNSGPNTATGQLDIVRAEGDVRLKAQGLPRLESDLYQLWLINSKTGQQLSVVKFNAPADGQVLVETVAKVEGYDFDLAVISMEREPDESLQPDARLSIAGYYIPLTPTPIPGIVPTVGAPPSASTVQPMAVASGTAQAIGTATPGLPTSLPRTGESSGVYIALFGLGAVLVVAGAIIVVSTRREQIS